MYVDRSWFLCVLVICISYNCQNIFLCFFVIFAKNGFHMNSLEVLWLSDIPWIFWFVKLIWYKAYIYMERNIKMTGCFFPFILKIHSKCSYLKKRKKKHESSCFFESFVCCSSFSKLEFNTWNHWIAHDVTSRIYLIIVMTPPLSNLNRVEKWRAHADGFSNFIAIKLIKIVWISSKYTLDDLHLWILRE